MMQTAEKPSSETLNDFLTVYRSLGKDNLHSLDTIYHKEVVFEDPAHRIEGFENLARYFESMYTNVNECRFDIHEHVLNGDVAYIRWTMNLSHPKLDGGASRSIEGCSRIEFKGGRVIMHRDYFDLGEMLYEALPVLGPAVRMIKKRLGQ